MKSNYSRHFSIILFFSIALTPILLNGQSVAEKLGGVATAFTITSDSVLLNADKQLIIARATVHTQSNKALTGGQYGYGLQSFYLEFNSEHKIQGRKESHILALRDQYYLLDMTLDSGATFKDIQLNLKDIQVIEGSKNNQSFYTYAIDLKDIPLVSLDHLVKLNVVRIE